VATFQAAWRSPAAFSQHSPRREAHRGFQRPSTAPRLLTTLRGHPKVSLPHHRSAASSGLRSRSLPSPKARSTAFPAPGSFRALSTRQPPEGTRLADTALQPLRRSRYRHPAPTRRSSQSAGCVRFVQPTSGSYFLRFQRTASAATIKPPLHRAGPPSRLCSI
jgi:hypothetical protein